MIRTLYKAFQISSIYKSIKYWKHFPGLYLPPSVNAQIDGEFVWGESCSIGEGCNLIVPENTSLSLGYKCYVGQYVEIGPSKKIVIGDHSTLQDRSVILGDVEIGAYSIMAKDLYISSGQHYFSRIPEILIQDQDMEILKNPVERENHSKPVTIGEDCWIGVHTFISAGVNIGKGCVIGANSVVTSSIPPYSIAAGVPARIINKRLDFSPPSAIRFDQFTDFPYFYSGFSLMKEERLLGKEKGGLFVKNHFSVWLSQKDGNTIYLKAKNCSSENYFLRFGENSFEISGDWKEYHFPIQENVPQPMKFWIEFKEKKKPHFDIIIQEIGIR